MADQVGGDAATAGRANAPPPLAVVNGAARALAVPGPPGTRFELLCERLCDMLPAEEVRWYAGERRSDRLASGKASPSSAACMVDISWSGGRHAVLEAVGSTRAPSELRPILETVAALLTASMDGIEGNEPAPSEADRVLYRLTIDSLPIGLYVVDREYRVVIWNRKREIGTQGLRRGDVLGRPIFEVLHRQEPEVLKSEFDRVFQRGETIESEHEVVGEAETRTYRSSRLPMRIGGGEISHVITIGADITQSRAIQLAMHQTEKLAAVGQLAAGVMHEINNPLATIGACVAAISARLGSSAEPVVREYLDIIESEVGRCTNIVDRLLDFSRSSRSDHLLEPTDVNKIVERTLYLLKPHQRFRRLEVELRLADELPLILGNDERLIQAMMAILLNAADAISSKGVVKVATSHENQWVVIELSDNGPGIPEEVLPKVFEPFYTTKGPGRGTGLGLAICYGIVADHSGRLDVRSEPGDTTFRLALPALKSEVAQ